MNTVVTGGAGFIGSHLASRLIALGHDVTIIDDLSTGSIANIPQGSRFIRANILNLEALVTAMEGAEIVFHLAALSSVALCNSQPELAKEMNVRGTLLCLYEAAMAGARKFILSSSASVYGNHGDTALVEDIQPKPESVYAHTKLEAEFNCQKYIRKGGISLLIPRYFNVIGDGQTLAGDWIIPNFFDRTSRGQALQVYGDGQDKRDYIFVEDAVDATIFLAFLDCSGIYNVGSGVAISVNEIVDAFSTLFDRSLSVEYIAARKGDLPYSCADISKLRQAGFESRDTFWDGLQRIAIAKRIKEGNSW